MDKGRKSFTCVLERHLTAGTVALPMVSSDSTMAAAPSDTKEQSERLSGPATKGFFSEACLQKSKPKSRFMCA